MTLRSLRTRAEKLQARLPDPAFCPGGCTRLEIFEADDPRLPLPQRCEVCGRPPQPGAIRVVVVVPPD
jgi:hypothetical protein